MNTLRWKERNWITYEGKKNQAGLRFLHSNIQSQTTVECHLPDTQRMKAYTEDSFKPRGTGVNAQALGTTTSISHFEKAPAGQTSACQKLTEETQSKGLWALNIYLQMQD